MNATSVINNLFSIGCIVLAMTTSSFAFEMRTWTTMNGKTTEAAYVRYDHPNVVIQRRDGKIFKINRDLLCDEDWIYVSKYDKTIVFFEIKIGEVIARICPGVSFDSYTSDDYDHLSGPRFNIDCKTVKQAASQHGNSLSFYCSTDKKVTVKFKDKLEERTISVFQMPRNSDTLFKLPEEHGGYSVYRTDGRLKTIKIEGPQSQLGEVFYVIEIALEPSIKDITGYVNKGNQRIVHFVLSKREANNFAEMASRARNLEASFREIPRYARIAEKIRDQQMGIPPSSTTASPQKDQPFVPLGTGSGFFITDDGYFISNHHVVEGGRTIQLMTESGTIPAKVVRIDPAVDLALLKAPQGEYSALSFFENSNIPLGTDIFTIGFPMPDLQGFSPKMTKGVISSMMGMRDDDKEYQIDAAVQPGNSGGPVVNNNGEVVGVVVSSLREQYVAKTKGILPQNVNYAIKKKHVIDFLSQVPNCLQGIKMSNLPTSGSSASPDIVESVRKSCAMVIVYE